MRTSVKAILVLAFVALVVVLSVECRSKEEKNISPKPTKDAVKLQWNQIIAEYAKISIGMSPLEVQEIIGAPSQVNSLYGLPMRIGRPSDKIGTTWFYLKEPKPKDRLGDHVLAVRFDLDEKVMKVDGWGLEP